MQSNTVTRTILGAFFPTDPVERSLEYTAPIHPPKTRNRLRAVWAKLDENR